MRKEVAALVAVSHLAFQLTFSTSSWTFMEVCFHVARSCLRTRTRSLLTQSAAIRIQATHAHPRFPNRRDSALTSDIQHCHSNHSSSTAPQRGVIKALLGIHLRRRKANRREGRGGAGVFHEPVRGYSARNFTTRRIEPGFQSLAGTLPSLKSQSRHWR